MKNACIYRYTYIYYIHIHMYVYMYTCIHVYIHIYMCIPIWKIKKTTDCVVNIMPHAMSKY